MWGITIEPSIAGGSALEGLKALKTVHLQKGPKTPHDSTLHGHKETRSAYKKPNPKWGGTPTRDQHPEDSIQSFGRIDIQHQARLEEAE